MKWIYQYHNFKKGLYQKFPGWMNFFSLAVILFWVFVIKSSVLDANNIPSGSMVPTLKIGDFLFVNKMRYNLRVPFTHINLLRFGYPQRGDIVTFIPPDSADLQGKTLVKRIVGMPGDHVKVKDDEVYINGTKYDVELVDDEEFHAILDDIDFSKEESKEEIFQLYKEKIPHDTAQNKNEKNILEHYMLKQKIFLPFFSLRTVNKEWIIPPNKYFVMGDNRDNSDDSRRWGYVDLDAIEGKVYLVYFSVNWMQSDNPGAAAKNPFINLVESIMGKNGDASVRWKRIGTRIN